MFARRVGVLALALAIVPLVVSAQAAIQVVPAAKLQGVADALVARLVSNPDQVATCASAPFEQTVPSGTLAIVPGTPQQSSSYLSIPLTILVDAHPVRSLVIGYRIATYVQTAIATRELAAGTVLTERDLALGRVLSNGRVAVDPKDLVGRRVRIALSSGASVYPEETQSVDLVKAGANAILIVRAGAVALTADVIARSAGGLGDTVTVFNPQTQKTLSGQVTGPNRIELDLPGAVD